MSDQGNSSAFSEGDLINRIKDLEMRVAQLEKGNLPVKTQAGQDEAEENQLELPDVNLNGASIESRFGEFGLAWLGNLVLLFGIIFLVQYFHNSGQKILAPVLGYISVAGLFGISRYLRNSHINMASIFSLNGYILLFFISIKLHYFTSEPLISNDYVGLIPLLIVTFFQGVMAVRKNSKGLAALAFIMGTITAIVSDSTHIMLPMSVLMAAIAVYFLVRYSWWRLLIFSIFLVYFINLIWFIQNPFMGHTIGAIKVHDFGFIYLFVAAAIYSMMALIKESETFKGNVPLASIIMNGLGFSFLITLYNTAKGLHKLSFSYFKYKLVGGMACLSNPGPFMERSSDSVPLFS